jgi:hypothetical protein
MRRGWVVGACLGVATSCTPKPPAGFATTGDNLDSWTFPLVGPLENSLLFVPVSVNDKGPFLFALDPDAAVSVIDEEVVKEGRIRTDGGNGPKFVDENGATVPRFFAEVVSYEIGPLVVQGAKPTAVVKAHTFDFAGRRVYGVIGHDILLDTLALSFDRDLGIATLTVLDTFKHPDGVDVKFTLDDDKTAIKPGENRVKPMPRRIAKAIINGQEMSMHLDVGGVPNQLRESLWAKAGLEATERKGAVIDETGTSHDTTQVGTVAVLLDTAANEHALFVPYADKRWPDGEVEGTLGLDFFKPFKVAIDPTKHMFYLSPRGDAVAVTKQRIARWNDTGGLAKCEHPGCVVVKLIDPLAGKTPATPTPTPAPPPDASPPEAKADVPDASKPAHPGVVISVSRDPVIGGTDFEVVLAVIGKPQLPWLVINMPSNVDRVMGHLPSEWLDTTPTVIDISPYPRRCAGGGSCIDKFSP